jgi:hypothetical protein
MTAREEFSEEKKIGGRGPTGPPINMIFLVGSGRRENFSIWDGRRRRSWSEHVTHSLPMKNSVVG